MTEVPMNVGRHFAGVVAVNKPPYFKTYEHP